MGGSATTASPKEDFVGRKTIPRLDAPDDNASMRTRSLHAICLSALVLLSLSACASQSFQLNKNSARDRLMSTAHANALARAIPSRHLICFVDSAESGAIYLYLGDDEGDHTTRIGFYRVTADGNVWLNADPTGLTVQWKVIQ